MSKWIALALSASAGASALTWALVTTGHWPLDDRREPAATLYALNGALGRWLVDHGDGTATEGVPAAAAARQSPAPPEPAGLTPAEMASVQEVLRSDPRFRSRRPFTPPPVFAPSGRG